MKPNRLPKILMQTACHVAGAGQFYQTEDCDQNLLPDALKGKKLFGCCIHPEFGGFFSMRAAVFTGIVAPDDLQQQSPVQLKLSVAQITDILAEFNSNWQAGKWRRIRQVFKLMNSISASDWLVKCSI